MSLRIYNRKRKFQQTPEPRGKTAKGRGQLRFVVQMHAATRLHFDLRLEFDGVFKSWAVPKGPSLNPLEQRLAVFVEDHPLAYGSFEGIIPKGNYGAGTVLVWDEGTYLERGSENRSESEAAMLENFNKGHLTFVLSGHKLKGEFALIKLKDGDKAWLLVKKRDEFSTYKLNDTLSNKSVKTGRTIEQIAHEAEKKGDVWLPKKTKSVEKNVLKTKNIDKLKSVTSKSSTKRVPLPRKVKPMIATLSKLENKKNWVTEPALNGLRAIAEVEGKRVSLYSKAGLSFAKKFPTIVTELQKLNMQAVFDGEIIDQQFYIYDLLYAQNQDLRTKSLQERKKLLSSTFKSTKHLKHISDFKGKSEQQIVKNPESSYKSGTTSQWLMVSKIKAGRKNKTADSTTSDLRLTNLDKIYFPDDGLTKGDLIDYYKAISPYILPYLKDRPQSLNRHPNGITRPNFYQKDLTGYLPRWLKTERIFSESANKSIDYALCQNEQSLLYLVNLGCIEMNPWFSRVGHLDKPDFLVIDLDPDNNPFSHVVRIAHEIHDLLEEVGAKSYCKTSGATGIHIGVPTGAKYDFDKVRDFAEAVCRVIARKNPALTSVMRNPERRKGKIYLDFMQNRRGQTLAAPFCLRPRTGAPVSMPLQWSELKESLSPEQFNIHNALSRIRKFDDPWKNVLSDPVNLPSCAKKLARKYSKD